MINYKYILDAKYEMQLFLKYNSFKKDNQKNCWSRTRLLPSNFFVLINTDSENYGQFILSLTEQSETSPFLIRFL